MKIMEVIVSEAGTMFCGPDSVRLYKAIALKTALKLHAKGIRVNRQTTNRNLLDMATNFTGRKYKKTELEAASIDVAAWIEKAKETADIRYE